MNNYLFIYSILTIIITSCQSEEYIEREAIIIGKSKDKNYLFLNNWVVIDMNHKVKIVDQLITPNFLSNKLLFSNKKKVVKKVSLSYEDLKYFMISTPTFLELDYLDTVKFKYRIKKDLLKDDFSYLEVDICYFESDSIFSILSEYNIIKRDSLYIEINYQINYLNETIFIDSLNVDDGELLNKQLHKNIYQYLK